VLTTTTFGKGCAKFNLWERLRQIQPLGKVAPKTTHNNYSRYFGSGTFHLAIILYIIYL